MFIIFGSKTVKTPVKNGLNLRKHCGRCRLLSDMQEHSFRPVGGNKEEKSDFRLVAATNRDLEAMSREGGFRKDLLYRLRSIEIEVPPLRARGDDIIEMALYYSSQFCILYGIDKKGFSPDFIDAILNYSWPGNVRELIHAIEHVIVESRNDPILFPFHLPNIIRTSITKKAISTERRQKSIGINDEKMMYQFHTLVNIPQYREFKEKMERHYLECLMNASSGSKKNACEISGLSRPRLYELLKKHAI